MKKILALLTLISINIHAADDKKKDSTLLLTFKIKTPMGSYFAASASDTDKTIAQDTRVGVPETQKHPTTWMEANRRLFEVFSSDSPSSFVMKNYLQKGDPNKKLKTEDKNPATACALMYAISKGHLDLVPHLAQATDINKLVSGKREFYGEPAGHYSPLAFMLACTYGHARCYSYNRENLAKKYGTQEEFTKNLMNAAMALVKSGNSVNAPLGDVNTDLETDDQGRFLNAFSPLLITAVQLKECSDRAPKFGEDTVHPQLVQYLLDCRADSTCESTIINWDDKSSASLINYAKINSTMASPAIREIITKHKQEAKNVDLDKVG